MATTERTWPPCDSECLQGRDCAELQTLQRRLADAAAVTHIELFARRVPSTYVRDVYDVSSVDELEAIERDIVQLQEDLRSAVRYLDLRGLLVRPVKGHPQFVSFAKGAA